MLLFHFKYLGVRTINSDKKKAGWNFLWFKGRFFGCLSSVWHLNSIKCQYQQFSLENEFFYRTFPRKRVEILTTQFNLYQPASWILWFKSIFFLFARSQKSQKIVNFRFALLLLKIEYALDPLFWTAVSKKWLKFCNEANHVRGYHVTGL